MTVGTREAGTVKWFNAQRGYGFITPKVGSEDLFVHFSSIEADGFRTCEEGQRVSFVRVRGEKGLAAEQVRVEWEGS